MLRGLLLILVLASAAYTTFTRAASDGTKKSHNPEYIDLDVWQHVHKLTLEQKIGQMTQLNIDAVLSGNLSSHADLTTVNVTRLEEIIAKYHVGSFLNSPMATRTVPGWTGPDAQEWSTIVGHLHKTSMLMDGIPTLFGIDSVHGANYIAGATLFPQQLNMAATFNRDLIERVGAVTAKDTKAAGIPWIFGPILDIAVNPLWPRVYETFGEDPVLVAEMGGAIIRGLQGVRKEDGKPDLKRVDKVAACFKHFIGYSSPRDGHDRVENWIPDRQLLEYFLPPFQAAIQKHQVRTGMLSYTDLNGVPATSNSALTIGLLRDDLQFNGTLVTDFNEILNLHSWHRVVPSIREAVSLALRTSSLDMAMLSESLDKWFQSMTKLVESDIIPMARVNLAVARVLQLKKDLGLIATFSMTEMLNEVTPITQAQKDLIQTVGSQDDRDLALETAHESIVLLQNDGTLPVLLRKDSSNPSATSEGERLKSGDRIRKILIVGPTGNSISRLTGGWTHHWQGSMDDDEFEFGSTIYEAVQKLMQDYSTKDDPITVNYVPGVNIDGSYTPDMLSQALQAAEEADLVIACLGEEVYAEKPGDISALPLPWGQQNLMNQLTRLSKRGGGSDEQSTGSELHNKRVIVVLAEGRPRTLDVISLARVRAVLFAGLPGPEGGQAIADIIFGLINPSGKLPITYPGRTGEQPIQYYHKHSQATNYHPQWEFGFGLTYTQFQYSHLVLSAKSVDPQATLDVSVDVKNTGAVEGKETVLLFLSDLYRIVSPEVKRLRGFEKILLQPGETKTVTFTLGYEDWSFIGVGLDRRTEAGAFSVQIGGQSGGFTLNESSDDMFDTEVILTRKQVKRWWKELEHEVEEAGDQDETQAEQSQPADDDSGIVTRSDGTQRKFKKQPRSHLVFALCIAGLALLTIGGVAFVVSRRRQAAAASRDDPEVERLNTPRDAHSINLSRGGALPIARPLY